MMLDKIRNYLKTKEWINFAYLFGSYVNNPSTADDIDIAVFTEEEILKNRGIISLQTEICLALSKLCELSTQKIDVVILNYASPLFKFEVITKGELIFERDHEFRIDFEVMNEMKFFDFEYYRNFFWNTTVKRLKEDNFAC